MTGGTATIDAERRQARREWAAIGVCTLLGGIVRGWGLGTLGLTHFDEGIYAIAGMWSAMPGGLGDLDPTIVSYAPPGFAFLVGLAYAALGIADTPAILVSILAGTATIPVAGWLGRRAFGPGAGAGAAALAALSGPHVAFSRMALTDATFLLTWLLAMAAGMRFLERPAVGRAVALGVAVGLAQNVKYNGWLSGVIVAGAALVGIVRRAGSDGARPIRTLLLLTLAGGIAALMYVPWFLFVESHGSYAGLIEHQRGYVDGWRSWDRNLVQQLSQVVALSGGWPRVFLAWLLCGVLCFGLRTGRWQPALVAGAVAAPIAAIFLLGVPAFDWLIGGVALAWLLGRDSPAIRLLGSWWLALTAITPLYHAYSRLWLPVVAVGWLLPIGGILALIRGDDRIRGEPGWRPWRSDPKIPRPAPDSGLEMVSVRTPAGPGSSETVLHESLDRFLRFVILALPLGLTLTGIGPRRAGPIPGLLQPTDGIRLGLSRTLPSLAAEGPGTLRVLARPPARYYLFEMGRVAFHSPEGLDQLLDAIQSGDLALIDEAQLRQEPDFESAKRRMFERLEPVPGEHSSWIETLNVPTLLDVDPDAAYRPSPARENHWWLLRPKPTPGDPIPTGPTP